MSQVNFHTVTTHLHLDMVTIQDVVAQRCVSVAVELEGILSSLCGFRTSRREAHVLLVVDGLFGVVELENVQDGLGVLLLLQLGDVGGLEESRPLLRNALG